MELVCMRSPIFFLDLLYLSPWSTNMWYSGHKWCLQILPLPCSHIILLFLISSHRSPHALFMHAIYLQNMHECKKGLRWNEDNLHEGLTFHILKEKMEKNSLCSMLRVIFSSVFVIYTAYYVMWKEMVSLLLA